MLILAVLAVLSKIAIPAYMDYKERIRVAQAVTDITIMSTMIIVYEQDAQKYPDSLTDIGNGGKLDPWNRPYVYMDLSSQEAKGGSRRDKNLNPLNSDFDLYSTGKDGVTQKQISAKDSLDDVIRANDGTFVGLASKYTH